MTADQPYSKSIVDFREDFQLLLLEYLREEVGNLES
jgi:hypothetical protein